MKEDHEEQNDLCVKFGDGCEFEKSTSGYSVARIRRGSRTRSALSLKRIGKQVSDPISFVGERDARVGARRRVRDSVVTVPISGG